MNRISKMPESQFDKLLKESRKRYRWAISFDIVLLILFVLLCTASYRSFILGCYDGTFIHCVPEVFDQSYEYNSTESFEESDIDS